MSESLRFTDIHHHFDTTGQGELFNTDADKRVEYKILTGHRLEDGTEKTQEQLLMQYVTNTDRLIGTIDGTLDNEPPFDTVIFLDKSGRPVAWLMDELWTLLARQRDTAFSDNVVPKMPDRYFLNIDREQWLPVIDPEHTGVYNIGAIPEEAINSLRAIYQPIGSDVNDKTTLDGKRVLIVDEVGVTGSTLKIAAQLLKRAIPDAEFGTAHWMSPGIFSDTNGSRNNDIPVWYKQHDARGRGVADRDLARSEKSSSKKQKIGKWFLSTVFDKPDESSLQLREEFKQLKRDIMIHKVLYTPCPQRNLEDSIERIETVNELDVAEYKALKVSKK
jgi:hypoxanthine phosphoribosyltransferase